MAEEVPPSTDSRQLIIVLEAAGLDYSRLHKKKPELLSHDENEKFIRERLKRDPEDYKPHIVHQCLLNLLDSPLNKAGLLKVIINTFNGQLIEVNPLTRIPRTYHRFSPLMGQLLKKEKIRSADGLTNLLRICKGPVIDQLPKESLKVAASTKGKLVRLNDYLKEIDTKHPVVFVVGAVDKGNPSTEVGYTQDTVSISRYRLSSATVCAKLLIAFESLWNLL